MDTKDCTVCGGSGFDKPGTGYDSVCDNCGGSGEELDIAAEDEAEDFAREQCRMAMVMLWFLIGFDIRSPKILDVDPAKIKVSDTFIDPIYATLEEQFPVIKNGERNMEWNLLMLQHAPRRIVGQEQDIILEEGAITYATGDE